MRIRTGFSFGTAFGHLEDVISRLTEIDAKEAPIADRNSCFAFARWTKLAKKANLRPIYGVEIGVVRAPPAVPPKGKTRVALDYWTFWAKDNLTSIHTLVSLSTEMKTVSLSYGQALAAKGVIRVTGNLVDLSALKPAADLYIPLGPATPHFLYREAKRRKFAFIATSDNFYPTPKDREVYRVIAGRNASSQSYPQHILSPEEWKEAVHFADPADIKSALANRAKVAKACKAVLPIAKMLTPEKKKTLRKMCEEGAKALGCNLRDPVYKARLDRELKMIADKSFEDYFYIIADMVQWARTKMFVGPARGSSCGSLVCYLLQITTVDPIPFGLLFERFIDINRPDLPDIDLDFSDKRRDLMFAYMEEKYGADHVARLGTVMVYRPRSALKEAGGALLIPPWETGKVLESILERSSGDSRSLQATEDTLRDTPAGRALLTNYPEIIVSTRIEGHPNASSTHAAGIVITDQPVRTYVATDSVNHTTHCDKKDAETLNLLKIDALGLTQLSIFEETMRLLKKPDISGVAGDTSARFLETIPLDDPAAFAVLNAQHWAGIFQFNGPALQSLAKAITFDHVEDLISITALARPGPLASGGSQTWVRRKTKAIPISYPHPLFEPFLKDSLGVVCYQEQVMTIGREIGDLSWADVTELRKAMSKSLGKEYFDRFGDRWKSGAIAKGIAPEIAAKVWDDLCAYGSWAFNRSHSVCYGLISYWCCWLKAHHPLEFAAATLSAESDPARVIGMLREMRAEGIDYVAVDAKLSVDAWRPGTRNGKRILVGPLTNIKGIGPANMAEILGARKRGEDVRAPLLKKLEAARTAIDSLEPIADAVKRLVPNLEAARIFTKPLMVSDVQAGIDGQVLIIGIAERIDLKDENEPGRIARRDGRKLKAPTAFCHLWIRDDTDLIFTKIDRFKFEDLGRRIIEEGKPRRSIFAVKGTVPSDFRMIKVERVKYLGEIDGETPLLAPPEGEELALLGAPKEEA